MTDAPSPITTNFGPIAATALASSAAGTFSAQPVGKAVADLLIWKMSLSCNCAPPANVCEGISLLCVTVVGVCVTAGALLIHYFFLKQKG